MSLASATGGDFLKETSTTVGTGPYILAGALAPYLAFSSWFADGSRLPYVVSDNAGGFEIGVGTLSAVGTILSRDFIWWSSNSGAAVSWAAGTRVIYCAASAMSSALTAVNHNVSTLAPSSVNDQTKGFDALSFWLHTSGFSRLHYCADATATLADWRRLVSSPADATVTSATSEVIGGVAGTASGNDQVILGGQHNAVAVGADGATAMGTYASAQHPNGCVHGGGAVAGRQQAERIVLAVQTTNATPTRMQLNNGSTDHLVLPIDGAWTVKAEIVAWCTVSNLASRWSLESLWKRSASGNPVQVGAAGGTSAAEQDGGAAAWAVALAADNTNKAIDVNVTGAAATTINWTATIRIDQVTS